MPEDFHTKVHEDISTALDTNKALLIDLIDRMARLETRVALFSALTGFAAGILSSLIVLGIQIAANHQ